MVGVFTKTVKVQSSQWLFLAYSHKHVATCSLYKAVTSKKKNTRHTFNLCTFPTAATSKNTLAIPLIYAPFQKAATSGNTSIILLICFLRCQSSVKVILNL